MQLNIVELHCVGEELVSWICCAALSILERSATDISLWQYYGKCSLFRDGSFWGSLYKERHR